MTLDEGSADELAAQLRISPKAVSEAIQRGFVSFRKHRRVACWWFGDTQNGCWRRLDGLPFEIKGQRVKAEAGTRGEEWHRLIGLDEVLKNDRREILLVTEGSKDALAALHFADAEGRLSSVGLLAALGTGVTLSADDVEKFRGRRVRIFGDTDAAGQETVFRVAKQLVFAASEVQIFSFADLHCQNGSLVKDLFDLIRIDCNDFEANRDLWSLTDLASKGKRVTVLKKEPEFSFSPSPLPHVSPVSHGYLVYPVSNCQELGKELEELALRNACTKRDTARQNGWQLNRDLTAVVKRIARKLNPEELMPTFDKWYSMSRPYLAPEKPRDYYLAKFLAGLGKVRVPTGEGEALKKALEHVATLSVPDLPILPEIADAQESWRRLAALHRELARQSANGTYFLTCRDAAKAHPTLNKDSALTLNRALEQLGVIKCDRVGDPRPGGKASEFRYLLALSSEMGATDLQRLSGKAA